jgi:hypothetical protein
MPEKSPSGPEGTEHVGSIIGRVVTPDGVTARINLGPAFADPHVAETIAAMTNGTGSSAHLSMDANFQKGYEAIFGKKNNDADPENN